MQARRIVRRTRGNRHGELVRLMSPSDLGQLLKPFVFLDHFDLHGTNGGTELHPHSGIATVTYLFEGTIRYEDSNGVTGVVPAGGIEFFKAAHGAWHAGGPGDTGHARGFQLWLALPPEQELGPVENIYLSPDNVPNDGPARVLVGRHGAVASRLNVGGSVNYMAVRLTKGESWQYRPPADHQVGWISISRGRLLLPDGVDAGELAVFESSNSPIEMAADSDAQFVIGSATPHAHDLALGNYSVHTSTAALRAGEQRLREIQHRLHSEGRL
jgi:redox-sensitive bicupin YhaK (pirin superfamily)